MAYCGLCRPLYFNSIISMVNIYKYIDYREWLKMLFNEKKKETPYFSYRSFGRMVDLDSSFLAKVIAGKKHLSESSTTTIGKYFELPKKELNYLHVLVLFAKAKSSEKKQVLYDKIISHRDTHSRLLIADQYEFFSKWYYCAIRNLLQIYKFEGNDYRELGRRLSPAISATEARKAVLLLKRLNLIQFSEKGYYELTELAITTGAKWESLAIRNYHQNYIELAKESIDRFPKELRDISVLTMNVGDTDIPKIKEMIFKFREELIQYVNSSATPEHIYNLTMQLFPFSKVDVK